MTCNWLAVLLETLHPAATHKVGPCWLPGAGGLSPNADIWKGKGFLERRDLGCRLSTMDRKAAKPEEKTWAELYVVLRLFPVLISQISQSGWLWTLIPSFPISSRVILPMSARGSYPLKRCFSIIFLLSISPTSTHALGENLFILLFRPKAQIISQRTLM